MIGNLIAIEEEEGVEVDGECSVMRLRSLLTEKDLQPQTMKLKGTIRGVPILLLVDSGATHNFISKKLAVSMGWLIEETKPTHIKLGNGYKAIA